MSTATRSLPARTRASRGTCALAIAGSVLGFASASDLRAADEDFQNFFFTICGTATGALGQRCGESSGGNLSGASESSLNPNQPLNNNDVGLDSARNRGAQAREDGDKQRAETDAPSSGVRLAIGAWSMLANVRGSWLETERESSEQERGYDSNLVGGDLGMDYRLSDRSVIGALISVEHSEADFVGEIATATFDPASSAGSFESDSTALTLFASFNPTDTAFIDLSGGYVSSAQDFTRNAVFENSTTTVQQQVRTRGSADGDQQWVSANGGFEWASGGWTYGPNAGITFARSSVDDYIEADLTGSGLSMRVDEGEQESLAGHVGFRAGVALSTTSAVVLPQFRVEWEHEFEDDGDTVATSFELDPADTLFALAGDARHADVVNVGVGIAAILPNGWSPFFDAELLVGDDSRDRVRAVAGVRKEL